MTKVSIKKFLLTTSVRIILNRIAMPARIPAVMINISNPEPEGYRVNKISRKSEINLIGINTVLSQ